MVALDILGIVRGWRAFDHVAHLGGAAFGLLYYFCGGAAWNGAKRAAAQYFVPTQTSGSPQAH